MLVCVCVCACASLAVVVRCCGVIVAYGDLVLTVLGCEARLGRVDGLGGTLLAYAGGVLSRERAAGVVRL